MLERFNAVDKKPLSIAPNAELEIARLKKLLKGAPDRDKTSFALKKIQADPAILEYLKLETEKYLAGFSYKPINQSETQKGPEALKFKADPETLDAVIQIVLNQVSCSANPDIILNALFKPAVLGKLAVVHEHGHFRPQTKETTPSNNSNEAAVKETLGLLTEEDAALRFFKSDAVKNHGNGSHDLYSRIRGNPGLFAKAAIMHHQACRELGISAFDTNAQISSNQNIAKIISRVACVFKTKRAAALSLKEALSEISANGFVSDTSNGTISESLFFKKTPDSCTAALSQFLIEAFSRGVKNVEIAVDMLPFDPSKRLPGEFSRQEIARVKKLADLLGLSLTLHSPIIGPCHKKTNFHALLEDPADNLRIMQETVSLAASIGANNIVVHLSDRLNQPAIERYAHLVLHAKGKFIREKEPVRIAFENYLSKKRADSSRPFPTMGEHLDAYEKVLLAVCRKTVKANQNPSKALKHAAILLDSAHFNLVSDFNEDPLKAAYDLIERAPKIAERLLADPEIGSILKKNGFSVKRFCSDLVVELHLNQNIGPIKFIHGHEHSFDIHQEIQSTGSIFNPGFIALLKDAGMGSRPDKAFIITAEQKDPLSLDGMALIHAAIESDPMQNVPASALKIKALVARGKLLLSWHANSSPDEYRQISSLITDSNNTIKDHYAYIAGRFGLETLKEHIRLRVYHNVMSAHVDSGWIKDGDKNPSNSPLLNVVVAQYEAGALIIKKGISFEEARDKGQDGLYLVLSGFAELKVNGTNIKLESGTLFGEQMLLQKSGRNADVQAGEGGLVLLRISRPDFANMCNLLPAFHDRLTSLAERRNPVLQELV